MANIITVSKYLITLVSKANTTINPLKLQKLLYYCEGWTLAITDKELFPKEQFQAWIHGPVNVKVYHEFSSSYGMFDPIKHDKATYLGSGVTVEQKAIIERVFEIYNQFSGDELEAMTHSEQPWIEARGALPSNVPSNTSLEKATMKIEFSQMG